MSSWRTRMVLVVVLLTGVAFAEEVHVYEQTVAGGVTNLLSDVTRTTGSDYATTAAPAIAGYIFTHWTSTEDQRFEPRDVLGRAREEAVYHLYQQVTLTAHYLPEDEDTDGDGVADGWEIYWYGDLAKTATSDTDGDGCDFAAELAAGTDPLMDDHGLVGGVVWKDSSEWLYNPSNYAPYVIRSEPEGALFETITEYVPKGTEVTTATYGTGDGFAYWSIDGVVQRDAFGCALDAVTVTMSGQAVEIVAHVVAGDSDEDGIDDVLEYYWYGNLNQTAASDSDGDGFTLAQELDAGTSPVMPDRSLGAGVVWKDSGEWLYNPNRYCEYVIRSEPEGALFETVSDIVAPGTALTTPTVAKSDGFAYWTLNGVRQADAFGRALDALEIAAPSQKIEAVAVTDDDETRREQMYWYGREQALDSDTDDDGYTFADELAAGTDPLMPDRGLTGCVVYRDGDAVEMNLQIYEQPRGVLVDGAFEQLFYSPIAGNAAASVTFGASKFGIDVEGCPVWPVVVDVNGDGLWDLIVCSETSTNVFVNVGTKGNPKFSEKCDVSSEKLRMVDLQMNSTAKLASMSLDVEPIAGLSATTNGATLLVSDDEGRIWYYINDAIETIASTWVLQHKVWGGSFAGFAQGLMLAAVDWEDDGDLDCICGTAEGKLMLLRDPKVGRPTGLTAAAGVDSVRLDWEPNGQSRVCGYKVYRSDEDIASPFALRASTALPTYRDSGLTAGTYGYKVSALSRFYTAGNSEPRESESVATDPVRAELGKVSFRWSDAAGFVGEEIAVDLAVQNSLNIAGGGVSLSVQYDAAVLQPVCIRPSGLTTNVTFTQSAASGVWNVTATGGEIAAGGGTFFSFVFKGLVETNATPVVLASATMQSVGGAKIPAVLPSVGANVKIEKYEEPERKHAQVTVTESAQVTAGKTFAIEVYAAGEGIDASSLSFDYVFDHSLLTRSGNMFTALDVTNETVTSVALTNVTVRATDGSGAVIDSVGVCSVAIAPESGGESGHVANLSLGSAKGKIGETVRIEVGIKGAFRATTVDLETWRVSVRYDEQLLRPVGLVAANGTYEWSATNGVMSVAGTSGTLDIGKLLSGWKYPVALRFELLTQYAKHMADVSFVNVEMKATNGEKVFTPVREGGRVSIEFVRPAEDPSVVVPCSRGDLNGDGRLTKEDKQLLAELMNGKGGKGKTTTAEQLRAGDYNGNGRLDQDDYQLMKDDFKARGIK